MINLETREQERKEMGGYKEREEFHLLHTVSLVLSLPSSGEAEQAKDSVCPCRL